MATLEIKRSSDQLTLRLGEHETEAAWQASFQDQRGMFDDAGAYGRLLFDGVFGAGAVGEALLALPVGTRLQITTEDPSVAAAGWEYLRTPDETLLAGRLCFVRGLPEGQRPRHVVRRDIGSQGAAALEIVAIPVSPVDEPRVLNVETEWQGIRDAVQAAQKGVKLVRVRPPTVGQMERTLNGQAATIIHFMGHSNSVDGKSALLFEDERGRSFVVKPHDFADSLDENILLVLLNSCRSAYAVDWTEFGNIARGLVRQGVPYALGMQFVIPDKAAIALSAALYDFLLNGRTVEDAVRRTRRALFQDTSLAYREWLGGIPVLYTSLAEDAPAISVAPLLSASAPVILPDAEQLRQTWDLTQLGARQQFVGRSAEITRLLDILLDANHQKLVVIQGLGGIGKTALVQAMAERIGWRYDDYGLALSFETFARRSDQRVEVDPEFAGRFYTRLARHYAIDAAQYPDTRALQYAILQVRRHRHDLLIVDNMETLFDALDKRVPAATALGSFVLKLRDGRGDVLMTSRSLPPADWEPYGRIYLEGLNEEAGAEFFQALMPPERKEAAPQTSCLRLSKRVDGHPLSLRLLAGRFARLTGTLDAFLDGLETHLQKAEQSAPASLEDAERQRTLYACMAYSEQQLSEELRETLRRVTVFQTPFPVQFAVPVVMVVDEQELRTAVDGKEEGEFAEVVKALVNKAHEEAEVRLQELVRLGMLVRDDRAYADGTLHLLELHPMLRWFLDAALPPVESAILQRYAQQYAQLAREAWQPIGGYDSSARMRALVRSSLPDLEASLPLLEEGARSGLAYHLAKSYERMGQPQRAMELYEASLKTYQALGDVRAIAVTQHAMATLLSRQGQPQRAMELYEASLKTYQQLGDVREIAVIQNAMATLLSQQGQPQRALELYEAALKTKQQLGDVREIAVAQNAMADLLSQQGQPQRAMELYEASLKTKQQLGDVREIAVTQHSMATLLSQQGQPQRALELYEASLKTYQQLGDVREIAVTQNAMADLLSQQGQPQRALELYEASLKTKQQLGDVREIAVTQHAMADLLSQQGQPQRALELYEASLKTMQALGDVREIAATQHAMATLLSRQGQPQRALELYEASLKTMQALGDVRSIAVNRANYSQLLILEGEAGRGMVMAWQAYADLTRAGYTADASTMQQLLRDIKGQALGVECFDALWAQVMNQVQPDWLRAVTSSTPSPTADTVSQDAGELMTAIRTFVGASDWQTTQQVVEEQQDLLFQDEVEQIFEQNIDGARSSGDERHVAFLQTHLELLRACKQDGIAAAFAALQEPQPVDLPVDQAMLLRIVGALRGSVDDKLALMRDLQRLAGEMDDAQLQSFYAAVQKVLVGGDWQSAGKKLEGVYAPLWAALVQAVEGQPAERETADEPDLAMFETIAGNTVAVLGPAADRRSEWRSTLVQARNQATAAGDEGMAGLVDAILGLLDANGDSQGLGDTLHGIYAQTWQAIVDGLAS